MNRHSMPGWVSAPRGLAATARALVLGTGLACAALMAQAQTLATPDWQAPVATPSLSQYQGNGVVLDTSGNAYLVSSGTSGGIGLSRVAPSGATQWSRLLAPAGLASGAGVLVDANGNAIVYGQTLAKFGPDGALQWSQAIGSGSDRATVWSAAVDDTSGEVLSLGVDAAGAVSVQRRAGANGALRWSQALPGANLFQGVVRLAGARLIVAAGSGIEVRLAAYDAATGTPLASRTEAKPGAALDVAIGPSNEIVVVNGAEALIMGNSYELTVYDSGLANVLLSKSLTVGNVARRVAIDAQRNIFITGIAKDPNSVPVTGPFGDTMNGPWADWVTVKLDPAGNLLWSARHSQRNDIDEVPVSLRVLADGSVLVAGRGGKSAVRGIEAHTVRYSAAGVSQWMAIASGNLTAVQAVPGSDGGTYVVGDQPQGTLWHYPGPARPTAVVLSSSSVTGGNTLSGRVQLSTVAGAVVTLRSSQPSVASVPASVTVPAGSSSATFPITTYKVRSTTTVTLSASTADGTTASSVLTVLKPSGKTR